MNMDIVGLVFTLVRSIVSAFQCIYCNKSCLDGYE